ncbi:MAG: LysR family transcriptional regulator [Xanthobacteraceae bacterium]|nr:LysR family transcriptional regulator [Xanthobacteraceae bacterium]
MDRIEAIKAFVTTVDEGSLTKAAARLGRSPAAMTRALAYLESEVGTELLHRTTRTVRVSEAGERYAAACRRILNDLDEAGMAAAGTHSAPRGVLTITAPVLFGTRILRPIVDEFLEEYSEVQVRYLLLDRQVNLTEEGADVALRIAHLPDSGLIATRVGSVRRVVAASPSYLKGRPAVRSPSDLTSHNCISLFELGRGEVWTFPPKPGTKAHRNVRITSRLSVNTIESMVRSAADGHGIVRVLSYQIDQEIRDGKLQILLKSAEPEPLPVHLIAPDGRLALPKVRAFIDFAASRLRARLQTLLKMQEPGPIAP